jgi:hypothetical protein
MVVGLVWGVATGFWELYKVTVRLNRWDQAEQGKDGRPKDAGPEADGPGKDRTGGDRGPDR